MRVLIIEDEHLIRECLGRVGQARGHSIQLAKEGLKGLQLWQSFHPHLIFLDILMPKMDGLQVLKEAGKAPYQKVVMMSAHRELSKNPPVEGVDLFIPKPFHDIVALFKQAEDLYLKNLKITPSPP